MSCFPWPIGCGCGPISAEDAEQLKQLDAALKALK
jgi:hypothetical protein